MAPQTRSAIRSSLSAIWPLSQTPARLENGFAALPLAGHAARMRIYTVQRRDWQDYRDIRLAALKDAPSAFAATWQQEAALTSSQWMERAQRSEGGDTQTIVIAVDDDGRWVGLAGGYRPGDRGADAELISMWVAPDCRGRKISPQLVRAVLAWADGHQAHNVGLWVNETNQPAISLYEKEGFRRTGEVDKLPSDPTQQEIHMLRRADGGA
jgi:RimJ/RimL family protein N-acetyltransferase